MTVMLGGMHLAGFGPTSKRIPARESVGELGADKAATRELIAAKIETYREEVGNLHVNVYWQVGLAVLCVLVVGRYSRDLEAPFIGVRVPAALLAFILPVVLCYLWLEFGYKLNGLIEMRLAISSYLLSHGDLIHRDSSGVVSLHALSQHPFLIDSGVVDGWFLAYWHHYTIHRPSPLSLILFGLVFGMLFALVHASILAALVAGSHVSTRPKHLGTCLLVCVFAVLVLSHWQFAWPSQNPNWVQAFVWLFTVVFLFYLLEYGEKRRVATLFETGSRSESAPPDIPPADL